jgi:hypothetical protein
MNIHMYQVNLAKYGNGVYHMAVRIYNGLSNKLKIISNNSNTFKAILTQHHLISYKQEVNNSMVHVRTCKVGTTLVEIIFFGITYATFAI